MHFLDLSSKVQPFNEGEDEDPKGSSCVSLGDDEMAISHG